MPRRELFFAKASHSPPLMRNIVCPLRSTSIQLRAFARSIGSLHKMWILPLVGYLGVLIGFSFLTLAIGKPPAQDPFAKPFLTRTASGLYYLSELVEEHTVLTRRILTRLIYAIIGIQALLGLVDRFPLWLSALSITSHVVYLGNLRHFPIVKLSDPVFILSCGRLFVFFPDSVCSHALMVSEDERSARSEKHY